MRTNLTFGSLFAGIGGIDLGFERAGLSCKWQVEIDDYARRVLAKHWPAVRRHDDVRTWPQPDTEYVDVIAGGFPCQDISYAGKGAGLGGERSGLFFELIRIVREMGPRFVVLENVAALLTRGLGDVLGTLASIGYDAEWHCIPAAAVGAPHIRDRVFILAYARCNQARGGEAVDRKKTKWGEGISYAGNSCCHAGTMADTKELQCNGGIVYRKHAKGKVSKPRNGDFPSYTKHGWWSAEPAVGRVADGIPNRVDRLRGLGNAVVPQVAELVARRVIAINNRIVEEQNAND
jgi:DNA (cytosine-5)-methyltransferase 1